MQFQPLGDQAVLAYCSDEDAATRFANQVRKAALPWLVDVVQAYASVAIYFDLAVMEFHQAAKHLAGIEKTGFAGELSPSLFSIPCCYEFGLDWPRLEEHTGLVAEDIIQLHCGTLYTVYAIGFCPGFPYMGYLPNEIAGVPALTVPLRIKLAAGSIGLTGRQTGIYTEERPGGWNIVGKTPLQLVDIQEGYFPLRTGDRAQFRRIDATTFQKLAGQRLAPSNSAGLSRLPYNEGR